MTYVPRYSEGCTSGIHMTYRLQHAWRTLWLGGQYFSFQEICDPRQVSLNSRFKKKTNQKNRKFCTGKDKKTCAPSDKNSACTGEIASVVIYNDQGLSRCWTKLQKAICSHALSFPHWHHFHDGSHHAAHDIGNHSQQHGTCGEIRNVK